MLFVGSIFLPIFHCLFLNFMLVLYWSVEGNSSCIFLELEKFKMHTFYKFGLYISLFSFLFIWTSLISCISHGYEFLCTVFYFIYFL